MAHTGALEQFNGVCRQIRPGFPFQVGHHIPLSRRHQRRHIDRDRMTSILRFRIFNLFSLTMDWWDILLPITNVLLAPSGSSDQGNNSNELSS